MPPPNLRSVVAKGRRLLTVARQEVVAHMKEFLVPSFKTYKFFPWMFTGYVINSGEEVYTFVTLKSQVERLKALRRQRSEKNVGGISDE